MDVRDCFGQLYGTDLLNTMKERPEFYIRLFSDLQLAPNEALIVDDNPQALAWAEEPGARTVLVGNAQAVSGGTLCIGNLAELPALL